MQKWELYAKSHTISRFMPILMPFLYSFLYYLRATEHVNCVLHSLINMVSGGVLGPVFHLASANWDCLFLLDATGIMREIINFLCAYFFRNFFFTSLKNKIISGFWS